jgi:Ring finger domain
MGQAFSNSQHESNSDRPPPPANSAADDSSAWSTAVDGGTSSPSISSRRRVLRSPLSSRGTRRPNPLRYEPPPTDRGGVQPPRLLTRLQQRLRRPTASGSETSSLVSPAESMMDVDSTPLPEDSSLNGSRAEGELASGEEDASQSNSTLSRLLTEVITSAVLDSLNQPNEERPGQEESRRDEGEEEEEETESPGEEGSRSRTFQLPRELFPSSMERSSSSSELGSFFRMLRMPASTFRSSSQTGETMPVFIIGYRATRSLSPANQEEERGEEGRRWVIYIISGSQHNQDFPASLFSDNPSYEDLMMLSHFLGPVRPVTATAQQIETIPIIIYRKDQMTEMINDKCQVCLEDYAESQELRMLQCKHGFHKDCIDRWLTEGRNCCPICRGVPVPHAD